MGATVGKRQDVGNGRVGLLGRPGLQLPYSFPAENTPHFHQGCPYLEENPTISGAPVSLSEDMEGRPCLGKVSPQPFPFCVNGVCAVKSPQVPASSHLLPSYPQPESTLQGTPPHTQEVKLACYHWNSDHNGQSLSRQWSDC